jgi:GT2 family glycosyltransferase
MTSPLRIVVGIATYRRRDVLSDTLRALHAQTRRPDRILISTTQPEDVDAQVAADVEAEIFVSEPGLCRQRNILLNELENTGDAADVIVFFDDDFIPRSDYLANVESLFSEPDIASATGTLVGDDTRGPGFSLEEADRRIAQSHAVLQDSHLKDVHSVYGCNMALNYHLIRDRQLRFDERLALYGWLEDLDFSRRLSTNSRIVESPQLTGVHRAVKSGRVSGYRLGFSQIMNPLYLAQKKVVPWRWALTRAGKNALANFAGCFCPNPYMDRPGRLRGNLTAFWHLLQGKLSPEDIATL